MHDELKKALDLLGRELLDAGTGLRGRCMGIVWHYNGCLQATLQPFSESGTKVEDAWSIDVSLCDVVGEGIRARFPAEFPLEPLFVHGQEVEDRLSGWKGLVSRVDFNLNGCISYLLISESTGGLLRDITAHTFDQSRLVAVAAETPAEPVAEPRITGAGPAMERVRRADHE